MNRALLLIASMLVLAAGSCKTVPNQSAELPCEATPEALASVVYENSDDPCFQGAIVIKGAKCSTVGVAAEHRYLAEHFPGYKVRSQALSPNVVGRRCPNRVYSIISITMPSGAEAGVAFDITEFYGN